MNAARFPWGDAVIQFLRKIPFCFPKTTWFPTSLFAVATVHRDLLYLSPRCIMGAVVLSLIYIYIFLLSCLFFLGDYVETLIHRHRLLNLNPWKKTSQSFSRFCLLLEERSRVFLFFFFLISGILGFLHRRFRNFLTVLFFYVTVLLSVLQLFLAAIWGPHSSHGGSDSLLLYA